LTFENLANNGAHESLFRDADLKTTMFRIVVKSNITMMLAVDLVRHIKEVLPILDEHGFNSVKVSKLRDAVKKHPVLQKAC